MPFLISFYLFMRIVRQKFDVPMATPNTTYYPPPKPNNEWDKLLNNPFNEYEW